jgi:hypothetical protein
MPLDEMGGCLAALIRAVGTICDLVGSVFDLAEGLGQIGRWTVRCLTFGRIDPNPAHWGSILAGLVMVAAVIGIILIWHLVG